MYVSVVSVSLRTFLTFRDISTPRSTTQVPRPPPPSHPIGACTPVPPTISTQMDGQYIHRVPRCVGRVGGGVRGGPHTASLAVCMCGKRPSEKTAARWCEGWPALLGGGVQRASLLRMSLLPLVGCCSATPISQRPA